MRDETSHHSPKVGRPGRNDRKLVAPPDVLREPLELFGTIVNLRRRLNLESKQSYQQTKRILDGERVDADQVVDVQDAWRAWKRQYLLSHILQRNELYSFVVSEDPFAAAIESRLRKEILDWASRASVALSD